MATAWLFFVVVYVAIGLTCLLVTVLINKILMDLGLQERPEGKIPTFIKVIVAIVATIVFGLMWPLLLIMANKK